MNAILKIKFPDSEHTFPVTWDGQYIEEGEDIAGKIFYSGDFEEQLDDGLPDMDISLTDNPAIKSRVIFQDEACDLVSSRSLDKLLKA
jgi:hypothetical protein